MDFLTLMNILMDLNNKVEGLSWSIAEGPAFDDNTLVVKIPLSVENAELINQALQLF